MTSQTEGDTKTNLLIKYDNRLRQKNGKIIEDVTAEVKKAEGSASTKEALGVSGHKSFPRVALDLATTVERVQKSFVVCDPSLPDCPIIFASDAFLELVGYPREEVLGRNCRFLQGPGTDKATVSKIKNAVDQGKECIVRLLNYKKDQTPFWNMFTLAPIMDVQGKIQFIVGVQVDVTARTETINQNQNISVVGTDDAVRARETAAAINEALKNMNWKQDPWADLQDATLKTKPHKANDAGYQALLGVQSKTKNLKLMNFRRIKQLGSGDVGLVDLVQLQGTNMMFAIKTLDKWEMQERNKVQRVQTEQRILSEVDHPFCATLYCTMQTEMHLHFVMEHCLGGELYGLLNQKKHFSEKETKFYVAEVLLALQYVHLLGYIYRDLKPENILIHESGHVLLTDFDLSFAKGQTTPRLEYIPTKKKGKVRFISILN